MRTLTIVSVLCGWLVSCSGSDPVSKNGAESNAPGNGNGDEPGGVGGTDAGKTNSNGDSTAARDIVFNEVAAVGASEWIEIANKGKEVVDVGNFYLADTDKTSKEPKKSDAMRFPAGTKIEPGGRLLILTSKKKGTVGPHPKAECLPDGPETCFFASFGVSATSGEAVHVLGPDGSTIASTALPKTASADAGGATNVTQCRMPDLTGDFATCVPTPGQPNRQ